MSDTLYVISTYYHAFIACVKQLNNKLNADIMVTDYIPEHECLALRLKESGLFSKVFSVKSPGEYVPRNKLDLVLNLHKNNAALIAPSLPMELRNYNVINIFHDDTWIAHYLKDIRLRYRLIEDGLDSFITIGNTPFAYMETKKRIVPLIKRIFHIGYVFNGYDPLTYEVEVNNKEGINVPKIVRHKLTEVPRDKLLNSLTEQDADVLKRIFSKKIPKIEPQISVLLLTQPLYADGSADSPEEQLDAYRLLVNRNTEKELTLVIKPHPRDTADYSTAFPEAVIFDKNMPAEMLQIYGVRNFRKSLGFNSTALRTVHADECVSCDINEYLSIIRREKHD